MDDKSILIRTNDSKLCFQKQDDNLIVLLSESELLVMNETAQFIYERCDKKTVEEIACELFEACKESSDITFEQVVQDCMESIKEMIVKGLVTIKE